MHLLTDKEFLELLSQRGVRIAASGEKLQINAPTGVLDDALRAELQRRKPQLLSALRSTTNAPSNNRTIPSRDATIAPLTFAQQRIWLIERFHPGNVAYNIPEAFVIEQAIDIDIFRLAVNVLIQRHSVLMTRIEEVEGEPVQRISPAVVIPVGFSDLSDHEETAQIPLLKKAIHDAATQPFNLPEDPLIRFHIFRLREDRHVVFFNVHHIIADQWSLGILRRELPILYASALSGVNADLPRLQIQYLDYALWEKEHLTTDRFQQQVGYWRSQLHGMPTLLELPFSRPRPALQSFSGATEPIAISKQTTDALILLSRTEGASLFMTVLAAFSVLLYRYSGQLDFCIGSPISSRNFVETEPLIGLFINTLLLRCKLDGAHSFRDILRATKETALEAYANGEIPFQKLVVELNPERDLGRSPFFQILFALDSTVAQEEYNAEQVDAYPGISKFDLTLQLAERHDGISGVFEYRTDLFDAEGIRQLSRHFSTLLQSIISNPDHPIQDLDVLSGHERDILLSVWNQTALDFPSELTVKDLFERQVEQTPNATAVIFHHERITYQELNRRANQLARILIETGAGPETLVGLCVDRSIDMIVAMLGVSKSGAAYVPLDPAYPAQRLKFMLADSQLKICVTHSRLLPRLSTSELDFVFCFDRDADKLSSKSIDNLATCTKPENAAYVIYTSGSTGQPKGVVVEQRNTLSFLYWAHSVFSAEALKGVLASTSICFDLSIFEIFFPLCFGHTVILADDILQITHLPAAEEITLLNAVPSAISALIKVGGLPKSLRVVNSAGEFLPDSLVQAIYESGNVTHVYDLYGPTETTTYSTFALRRSGVAPTIGHPIANTRVYLLDTNLQPVPTHVIGEIFIAGSGVTRGYLGRKDLTDERFISLAHLGETGRAYKTGDLAKYRTDGSIEYVGRADQQVKLRGYRIELGEIESAIRSYPGVHDAVVKIDRNATLGDVLIGYIATSNSQTFDKQQLFTLLRERLPAYMVVSQVVVLERFPLTANGKVDRKALLTVAANPQLPYVSRPPSDLVERQLTNIWEHCFERSPIGIDDNFFEIGGHSLLAFRIFSLIEKSMGKTLMLAVLFQAPTIASLAEVIRADGWKPLQLPIHAIRLNGRKPAIYGIQSSSHSVVEYENLARHLSSEQPVYMMDASQECNTGDQPTEQTAKYYAQRLQQFQPDGPYLLCASESTTTFAYEIAQELTLLNSYVVLMLFDPGEFAFREINAEKDTLAFGGLIPTMRRLYKTSLAKRTSDSRPATNSAPVQFRGKILILNSELSSDTSAPVRPGWLERNRNTVTMQIIACPRGTLLVEPYAGMTASAIETFLAELSFPLQPQ